MGRKGEEERAGDAVLVLGRGGGGNEVSGLMQAGKFSRSATAVTSGRGLSQITRVLCGGRERRHWRQITLRSAPTPEKISDGNSKRVDEGPTARGQYRKRGSNLTPPV